MRVTHDVIPAVSLLHRYPRSGWHVKDLVEAAYAPTRSHPYPATPSEQARVRMLVGIMWEKFAEGAFYQVGPIKKWMTPGNITYHSQVMLQLGGITGTPDGLLSLDVTSTVVEIVEYKARFGALHNIHDQPEWIAQVQAYCYMAGTTKASIYVLILSNSPEIGRYVIEFTTQELAENWAMLLHTKASLEEKGWQPPEVQVQDDKSTEQVPSA